MKRYLPYFVGSILYIVSAARYWAQHDLVGAAIAGVAGTLAILFPLFMRKKV